MTRYVLQRIALTIPVLLGVLLIVFSVLRLAPGDPARLIAGEDAKLEDIAQVRAELKLDRPIVEQFGSFLLGTVQGDFGRSYRSRQPVIEEIRHRLPATLELALAGTGAALLFGVPLGVLAATHHRRLLDIFAVSIATLGISMPVFWLGILLIAFFSVALGILPTAGRGGLDHLVLPTLTLGISGAAIVARMTRASMLEVLHQDYVRTARAKGLYERVVVYQHALKNALVPIITIVGLHFGYLLGGAVITETVFAWPGLGRLLVEAVSFRDFPVIQALVLIYAFGFAVVNLIVDLSYAVVDPRIRYS